jgi:aryl-alcohol dehydrogenase-like predicted oxidoreductase
VELGIDLIDAADRYGPEVDETLIAEALHPDPSGLVIATKGGCVGAAPTGPRRRGRPDCGRAARGRSAPSACPT